MDAHLRSLRSDCQPGRENRQCPRAIHTSGPNAQPRPPGIGKPAGWATLTFSGLIRRPTRSRRGQLGQNPARSVKARLGANGQTGIFLWIQTDLSGKTNDNGETIALDSPSKLEWKSQASLPPARPRSKVRHGREDRLNSFGYVVFSSRSRSTPASNRPGRFFWACPAALGGGPFGFAGAFPRFSGSP